MVSRKLKSEVKLPVTSEENEKDNSMETSPYKRTASLENLTLRNIVRVSTSKLHENLKDSEDGDPRIISYKKTDSLDKLKQKNLVKASVSEFQEANKDDGDNSRVVSCKDIESLETSNCRSIVMSYISKLKDTEFKNSGDGILHKKPESPVKLLQHSNLGPPISTVRDISSDPCAAPIRSRDSTVKTKSALRAPRIMLRKYVVEVHRALTTFVFHLCMPSQPGLENKGSRLTG